MLVKLTHFSKRGPNAKAMELHLSCNDTVWHEHYGCHLADKISKRIFLNENVCILVQISLMFITWGPVDNK